MAWFKVDDTFAYHAKVLAAGNAAAGLWVRAGAWSMQQLTDGFVPDSVARLLGTAVEARRLVDAGLWDVVDGGGYRFHEWTEVQRTKEQVKADRDAAAERQRRAREAAKSRRESREQSRRDGGVSHAGSHGPPDQTRPDQTSSSSGTTTPSEGRGKRAQALPSDWEPSEAHAQLAAERGVSLAEEAEKFRDWAASNGATKKDWEATFRNWIRNARPTARPDAQLPRVEDLEQPPDGLTDEEYADWYRNRRRA